MHLHGEDEMLSKLHPKHYGLAQVSSTRHKKHKLQAKVFGNETDTRFVQAMKKAQEWSKNYTSADDIPDHKIPRSYSFKDIDGFDFTQAVRDQKSCGSCYTTSFVQVVESRLMLRYGYKIPQISMQFLLSCNYMNEGCEGGWPLFNGYLAENGYLVSE